MLLVTVWVAGVSPAAGVGERAGHEAVERGSLRRDGEGLDRRGCDSQRWTTGGGAGELSGVCDGRAMCGRWRAMRGNGYLGLGGSLRGRLW